MRERNWGSGGRKKGRKGRKEERDPQGRCIQKRRILKGREMGLGKKIREEQRGSR